jgi:hypothetical protein
MPWKPAAASEVDRLKTVICCLRRELENKEGAVGRLELLLHERLTKIDELTSRLEQSREQIRRLDLQNEILIEMIAAPPVQTAEITSSQSQAPSAEIIPSPSPTQSLTESRPMDYF